LRRLHAEAPLMDREPDIDNGLGLSIDLKGPGRIGWRAKRHTGLIDVDRVGALAGSGSPFPSTMPPR
jgi:dCTP deaminase